MNFLEQSRNLGVMRAARIQQHEIRSSRSLLARMFAARLRDRETGRGEVRERETEIN